MYSFQEKINPFSPKLLFRPVAAQSVNLHLMLERQSDLRDH